MQLTDHPEKHLTYCTNIHPGESWNDVFNQLKNAVPELKNRISPSNPFGIGLRLSGRAASTLLEGDRLKRLKDWLQSEQLYVFTMNGFPYGDFHGTRVKDNVYAPDWSDKKRVEYTLNLIKILSQLLPKNMDGGISTSPLSYKFWAKNSLSEEDTFRKCSQNLALIAYKMNQIAVEEQKDLHLDIEPEPDCLLENSRETVNFFQNWLLPEGCTFLSEQFGLKPKEAEAMLKKHIAVCYDTCHFAVEYEKPSQAIERLTKADIRIGKMQISAALKLDFSNNFNRNQMLNQLNAFEESTYLHQVIERQEDGTLFQYRDLSEALNHIQKPGIEEWRIHYHVPVFVDKFNMFNSTRDDIIQSWVASKKIDDCHHYEIETYTWEVLPEKLKSNLIDSIEQEFQWVLKMIQ